MDRVPSHPVLSCAEAKAWETALLRDEVAEWSAMQRAGAALAEAMVADFKEIGGLPGAARLLVLVGKGHNGGDALLAAEGLLRDRPSASADVVFVFGEASLRPLAARAWQDLPKARVRSLPANRIHEIFAAGYDLCLDGVFGFQFRLPLEEPVAEWLARVNTHPRIRLRAAVDLPSGLGEASAGTVFRADFTYATGIVKSPVVRAENAPFVGRLRYLDLDFFSGQRDLEKASQRVLVPEILAPLAALRPSQTDKRTYGHLLVVGGSRSYPGAVVLAVRAALRSGVGLVTAFVPERLVPEYAARHPEAMWVGCPEDAGGGLAADTAALVKERQSRGTALLMGPGMSAGAGVIATMQAIVRNTNIPVVFDADALRPEVLAQVAASSMICTPHAGEYQRIGGRAGLRPAAGPDRIVAVLKGPLTRVVSDIGRSETGPAYYSPYGGPVLARGGSGDLLAGLIGGLLAQAPADPLLAACRGAVWHGRAADLLARARGQVSVEISEILERLGPALHP